MADNAKKKARTESANALLDTVMQAMADNLKRTVCEHCGSNGVTAADISNALKFLKDNGFSVDQEDHEDVLAQLTRERNERKQQAANNGGGSLPN